MGSERDTEMKEAEPVPELSEQDKREAAVLKKLRQICKFSFVSMQLKPDDYVTHDYVTESVKIQLTVEDAYILMCWPWFSFHF